MEVLEKFGDKHADAKSPLVRWITVVEGAQWRHTADMTKTFRNADVVGTQTVFNIGGNKYRLISRISYGLQTVLVEHVLTHAEYDKEGWK